MSLKEYFSLSGSFSRVELAIAAAVLLAIVIILITLRRNFPDTISETLYTWLFLLLYPIWGMAVGKRSRDLGTTFAYGMIIGMIIPIMGVVFLFQAGNKSRKSNSNKQSRETAASSPRN